MLVPLLSMTLTAAACVGADPTETLPPPREVAKPEPIFRYYRQSLDRWDYYRPGFQRYPVPVVAYAPGLGEYYLYNGQPYLYAPQFQTRYANSMSGIPYRLPPQVPMYLLPPAPVVVADEEAAAPAVPARLTAARVRVTAAPAQPPAAPERMPYCED